MCDFNYLRQLVLYCPKGGPVGLNKGSYEKNSYLLDTMRKEAERRSEGSFGNYFCFCEWGIRLQRRS